MPRLHATNLAVVGQARGSDPRFDGVPTATANWLRSVEAADGAPLEPGVFAALVTLANYRIPLGGQAFYFGGARTLAGALVPLVGPSPVTYNLVTADHSRTTGIAFDGINKAIGTNVAGDSYPQNDFHLVCDMSVTGTNDIQRVLTGTTLSSSSSGLYYLTASTSIAARCRSGTNRAIAAEFNTVGVKGIRRVLSTEFVLYSRTNSLTSADVSALPSSEMIGIGQQGDGAGRPFNGSIRYQSSGLGSTMTFAEMRDVVNTCTSAIAAALA